VHVCPQVIHRLINIDTVLYVVNMEEEEEEDKKKKKKKDEEEEKKEEDPEDRTIALDPDFVVV
jgi:hypothetical protein